MVEPWRTQLLGRWRADSTQKLTVSNCQDLIGDAGSLDAALRDLSEKGLINYGLFPAHMKQTSVGSILHPSQDELLLEELFNFLRSVDTQTLTNKKALQQMSERLGVDLTPRRKFLYRHIKRFMAGDDAAIPAGPAPATGTSAERVIVIGAGAAGLAAALHLQGLGAEVTVLEAQDRVGGRALTRHSSTSQAADLGAWCLDGSSENSKDHDPLRVLIGQLGLECTPLPEPALSNASAGTSAEAVPSAETLQQVWSSNLNFALKGLAEKDRRAVAGPLGAPNLSLKDLLAETMTQATPPNGVSLEESQQRQLSWYHAQLAIKLGAPLEQVAATAEAVAMAQTGPCTVCWGGLGQVMDAMAARLTDLRLNTVVTTIDHTASGVSVHTSTGEVLEGRAAILAVPLGCIQTAKIVINPRPPAATWSVLAEDLACSRVQRVLLHFTEKFWESSALFGCCSEASPPVLFQCLETVFKSPVLAATFLDPPREGPEDTHPAGQERLQAIAMAALRDSYGPGIPLPVQCDCHDWLEEPNAQGSGSYLKPGCASGAAASLAEPVSESLLLAGEYTSTSRSSVSGALASGLRAAAQALSWLRAGPSPAALTEGTTAPQDHDIGTSGDLPAAPAAAIAADDAAGGEPKSQSLQAPAEITAHAQPAALELGGQQSSHPGKEGEAAATNGKPEQPSAEGTRSGSSAGSEESDSGSEMDGILQSPSLKRRRSAGAEDADPQKRRLRHRAGSPRSDDEGGPALHVPYLQEPARHDVGAAERAALREELKGFLRVCELAKSGNLFPLEEVILEAQTMRTREHYLSCLAGNQSSVLPLAARRPAILHAFRDWLEYFLTERASPDALHTIIQVLGKLPMTGQMLKGSGLLAMLQQAVKEIGEGSPAREPATKTLHKWRTLMRPVAAPSATHASNGVASAVLPSGVAQPQPGQDQQQPLQGHALDLSVEQQRQAAEAAMKRAREIAASAAEKQEAPPPGSTDIASFEEFMQHGSSSKASRRKNRSENKPSGAVRRPKEVHVPKNHDQTVELVQKEVRRFITQFFVTAHKAGTLDKETAKALVEKTAGKVLNQPDYTDPTRAKVTPERKAKIQQLMEKEVAKATR